LKTKKTRICVFQNTDRLNQLKNNDKIMTHICTPIRGTHLCVRPIGIGGRE
jgi:hypothetical protein